MGGGGGGGDWFHNSHVCTYRVFMHEVVYVVDGVGLGDFTLSIVKRFIWILQLSPKICIQI